VTRKRTYESNDRSAREGGGVGASEEEGCGWGGGGRGEVGEAGRDAGLSEMVFLLILINI